MSFSLCRVGDIRCDRSGVRSAGRRLRQCFEMAAGQHHAMTGVQQNLSRRTADATARTRYDDDFRVILHGFDCACQTF